MARIVVLLLAALAGAAVALPAIAATPSEGTVGPDAPQAKWTGTVSDPLGAGYAAAAQAESAADVCEIPAPACDTYTLTVAGGGAAKLTVAVKAAVAEDWVGLSVTDPAGQERLALNESAQEAVAIDSPAAGVYTVRVLASPAEATEVAYEGVATLELPPPPPPPPPAATPAPPPPPAPAPEATPPPPAPVQAGPRELAIAADKRRVAVAVRDGFRTRVVCRGGCAQVRLRVFVSSLTARIYGLGRFKGDVHVGGAPVLRNAEGRRVARITFKRSVRKRLGRAKNLTLAIEAIARDADGRVRATTKRHVLRR